MKLLNKRVSRQIFLDDGTWDQLGDKCLAKSPLKIGSVIVENDHEILVLWDNCERQRLLKHGVDLL